MIERGGWFVLYRTGEAQGVARTGGSRRQPVFRLAHRSELVETGRFMTKTRMDSDTFLSHLRQSGLVADDELDAVLGRLPINDRGRPLARALVDHGLLTKFQAELLLVGRTNGFVLGQYRILDQLGQGGMGRVFKAEHVTMGRTVAIKVLAPQHTRTE